MGIVSSSGGGLLRAQGLSAAGHSLVSVSGGSFTASGASSNLGLRVLDKAQVILFGEDFNLPFGPISLSTGTITGTLQSGESIDISFFQSSSCHIIMLSGDIDQLCPCENQWKNHGQYVSCVARAAEDFVAVGLITDAKKDAIVSGAGQSFCGK